MKKVAKFYLLLILGLTSCGPVEDTPPSEPVPVLESETKQSKTDGPVVTIHCTLKNAYTGLVTTGTYFTYDMRTKNMPSAKMLKGSFYGTHDDGYTDNFKKTISPYSLTDGIVVLPLKQQRNKFRLELENIWYSHGRSWHFFEARGDTNSTAGEQGHIGFGKRGKGVGLFEGYLQFSGGNQWGGTAGIWTYFGSGKYDPKAKHEWGYLHCNQESVSGERIKAPYLNK